MKKRRVLAAVGFVFFIAYAAVRVYFYVQSLPYLPLDDPDAGPVRIARSECFLAKVNKTGKLCPEPAVVAGDAASYLARARYFMEMEEHGKALADVDAVLVIDGDDAYAHHLAGRLAYTLQDIERADREMVAARRLRPGDPRIDTSYAMVLTGRRANAEALRVLSGVIARHPEYLFARWQRARLYSYLGECCGSGNFLAALPDFDVLIRQTAANTPLLAGRAHVLLALGRAKAAASDLTAALQLAPHRSPLIRNRATAYARAGMYEDAVKDLDALLATQDGTPIYPMLDNQRAQALMDRADAFVELHRYNEAAKDAVAAVTVGGKAAVLRAQVKLRRHGFPDVPLDGQVSDRMRQALSACFGLKSCYHELRAI